MSFSGLIVQLLNGLAGASSLFLVAAGLSLIFGVTRIVNFAHGSFYMAGTYIAYSLVTQLSGTLGFWGALPVAAIAVGVLGAVVEVLLLRRIYRAPELFQLLATFALMLIIKDAVLWLWGPDELLGPRAPGLSGAVSILGREFPSYDLFLVVVGPAVLGLLWLLLNRTRWGTLVRAATQDRDMVGALGINQAWLFTAVFALGAALLSAELKAVCIWLGVMHSAGIAISFSKLTLVVDFLVMAVVLVVRPWGLLGRPQAPCRP